MADIDPAIPLLQQFEGFKDTPYWDVNHYRVGYGSDTITKPDGTIATVQPGMKVTQEDAMRDLQRRAGETQSDIKSSIGEDAWNKLSPGAKASLTSVAYNYGHLPYGVQTAAASGDPGKIASAIQGLAGHNDGVNAGRRQAEANNVLGIGAPSGKFSLGGVTPVNSASPNPPNASASGPSSRPSGSPSFNPATITSGSALGGFAQGLSGALNQGQGKYGNQSLIGALLQKANGGAQVPGLKTALSSLFGGSNQAGQGAPDQAGTAASAAPAPPAPDAAPPQPPVPSDSQASGTGGTSSMPTGDDIPMPPPRPADLGTPVADASSGGGLDLTGALSSLFG